MTDTTAPLLCDNPDVMNALLAALSDPGSVTPRAPLESVTSWQRRAVIEHAAPYILATAADSDTALRKLLERTEKALTDLQHRLDTEVGQAVAKERERIRQMAVRTGATCYSAEGTSHFFAALLEPEGDGNG